MKLDVRVEAEREIAEAAAWYEDQVAGLGERFLIAVDAAIEPEASDVRQVGGGDVWIEIEEDADVAAAGFVNEIVEIVESAVAGVEGLGVCCVGLKGGEEEGVGAEGVDVVEMLDDAMEGAASGGVEVDGVDLVDDGVLPPDVGADA